MVAQRIYEDWADAYIEAGYSPVAVRKKAKGAANPDWNKHVPELPSEEYIDALKQKYGAGNIGLATGTRLRNGRLFSAIDVDHPGFSEFIKTVLRNYVSGKIGSKGLTAFCQADNGLKSAKLKAKGQKAFGVEMMIDTGMIVIPPSIHPNGNAYVWDETPLLDIEQNNLPVLDAVVYELIKRVVKYEAAWEIVESGATVKGHELMLALTASGIAHITDDLKWVADCLNALFHQDYKGNTAEETLEMLESAKEKGLGLKSRGEYAPDDTGPLPLGYLEDGRYVFLDQMRSLLLVESSNRLMTEGTLLNMAPMHFWLTNFPKRNMKGQIIGIDCRDAADSMMQLCRSKGGFDTSRVRGRGVWMDSNRAIVINWGDKPPQDSKYIYVCHLPLEARGEKEADIDAKIVLELFQQFNWSSPSEAYLLLGWAALAVICGVVDWRPHIFISGPKNAGKTTIILALMNLLEPVGIALDGQSTEAGIRQKTGPDSRPVILDEFESDQNVGRMKSVIKLIRSASSAKYSIARGTPDGKAMEFCIRSCFLMGAINPFMVTAADRSRIVVLKLHKHANDKTVSSRIAEMSHALDDVGPNWCKQVIKNTDYILKAIKTLQRVFPPCESRHALNMASLMAAAWVMLHQREMTEEDGHELLGEHTALINELAEAHEEDDAVECLNMLLGHRISDRSVGANLAMIKYEAHPNGEDYTFIKNELEDWGIRWTGDGFLVANSHPGIRKIFKDTLWDGGAWVSALQRVQGARKEKQKRFSGSVRSLAIWLPASHLSNDYVKMDYEGM